MSTSSTMVYVHLLSMLPQDSTPTVLLTLRFAQPLLILAVSLISLIYAPSVAFAQRVWNSRAHNDSLGASTDSGLRADPEPTPVIVPLRSRTRFLTHSALIALAATYLLSGVIIVLRAVIPPRVWTPDLPLWYGLDAQALLGMFSWSSVLLACLYEEKRRGRATYGRGKAAFSTLFGASIDVALVAVFLANRDATRAPTTMSRWTLAQLVVIVLRLALLYPLLIIAISWDRVQFVRASDLHAQREGEASATGRRRANRLEEGSGAGPSVNGRQPPNETSGLLQAPQAGGSYGATLGADGSTTPLNKLPNGTRSPARDANAAMGLSVTKQPPPPTMRVFLQRVRILFPYLWPSESPKLQALAALCVFLLLCGRIVNLLVPLTLGRIVESLSNKDSTAVWWLVLLYAALKMLQGSGGFLAVAQNVCWIPLQQYSDRSMSLMAFEHLLNLSMSFHAKRKTGEVLRILDRGAAINNLFQYIIFQFCPIFIDIAVAMVYLGRTFSPGVGITLFVVAYAYTYASVKVTTWRTDLRRISNNKDSVCRAINTDVLLNYETVKHSANEWYERERYRTALVDYQKAEFKTLTSLNLLNMIQNAIISIGTLLTTLMVARAVVKGTATPSQFVSFITYLAQIYGPLGMLGTLYRMLQGNLVDTDKLMSLLEEETDVKDLPDAKELVVTDGIIEFRDVHFSYDGRVEALKGINFTIDARSSYGLCGESGSGKSTILRLLFRFYDVQSGAILIDGQDIRHVTQKSLRKAIGIVPQEPSLFNTDIRHNILYGDVNASDEAVEAAAAAAQILERIQGFPDGFSTITGERGVRLSGGEKQRVAIARTILKNPPLLLLDEATSALDSQTERQLQTALGTLMKGRTTLSIAHRLGTLINCDNIVVMDDGVVVESGSHAELLEKGGRYANMWQQQIKTQAEQEAAAAAIVEQKDAAGLEDVPLADAASAALAAPPGMLGIVPPAIAGDPVAKVLPTGEGEEDAVGSSNDGSVKGKAMVRDNGIEAVPTINASRGAMTTVADVVSSALEGAPQGTSAPGAVASEAQVALPVAEPSPSVTPAVSEERKAAFTAVPEAQAPADFPVMGDVEEGSGVQTTAAETMAIAGENGGGSGILGKKKKGKGKKKGKK